MDSEEFVHSLYVYLSIHGTVDVQAVFASVGGSRFPLSLIHSFCFVSFVS